MGINYQVIWMNLCGGSSTARRVMMPWKASCTESCLMWQTSQLRVCIYNSVLVYHWAPHILKTTVALSTSSHISTLHTVICCNHTTQHHTHDCITHGHVLCTCMTMPLSRMTTPLLFSMRCRSSWMGLLRDLVDTFSRVSAYLRWHMHTGLWHVSMLHHAVGKTVSKLSLHEFWHI